MSDLYWIIPLCVSLLAMGCAWLWSCYDTWQKVRLIWPFESFQASTTEATVLPAENENPYAAPQIEASESIPLSAYAKKQIAALEELQFLQLHSFRSNESNLRQIRYECWLSAMGDTLVLLACGRRWFQAYQFTQLISFLEAGNVVTTLDSEAASEYDLARMNSEKVILETTLEEMVLLHYEQLSDRGAEIKIMSPDVALQYFRVYRRQRIKKLVASGQAKFLEAEENAWRYTFSAACVYTLRSLLRELRRAVWSDRWSTRFATYRQQWRGVLTKVRTHPATKEV